MTPKLQISTNVLQRFEKVRSQCSGCLFGVWYDGTLLILGFNVERPLPAQAQTDSPADKGRGLNFKRLQNGFPAELDLCGLVKFGLCTDAEAHLSDILQDIDVTDNPIVLHCDVGTSVGLRASLFKHGQLERIEFEVVDEQRLRNEFVYTRLSCVVDVKCVEAEAEAGLRRAMQKLRVNLASGRTGFNIKNTNVYLMGGGATGTTITGCPPNAVIADLLQLSSASATLEPAAQTGKSGKKKSHSSGSLTSPAAPPAADRSEYETLGVKLLLKLSSDAAASLDEADGNANGSTTTTTTEEDEKDDSSAFALHVDVDPTADQLTIPLLIGSLALLHRRTRVTGLYDILIEGLCRSVRLLESGLVEQEYLRRIADGSSSIGVPCTYNYLPAELGHFFSCVYLTGAPDADAGAMAHRRRLHEHFGLGVQRPLFRKTNRWQFAGDAGQNANKPDPDAGKLVNTHRSMRDWQLSDTGGRRALVAGSYTYHHYMQDGFNDNGWGCAYRSLQTLCSWFRWQDYTQQPVPDHRAIQRYLVEVGDKPHGFVGSRQWIGSMEVAMCLDGLMEGVQCRIVRVSTGAEMAQQGSVLVRHFETHGTPVMIGGGVLAHTILGVDFNASTGDLKFLILDPHYTGADDIGTVLAKRWCAWKGTDFWDKTSYYNMCMPQLPTEACF